MNEHMERIFKYFLTALTLLVFVVALTSAVMGQATESTLYSFTDGNDGAFPYGGLISDANGNLYGVTESGPNSSGVSGEVYELSPDGTGGYTQTVLHVFDDPNGGIWPVDKLTFDSAGNLYGVTKQGGSTSSGVVYKLSPNNSGGWNETVLYAFTGGADGGDPFAGVIIDSKGNLYGTTTVGGNPQLNCGSKSQTCGVVYKLSPTSGGHWTETVLYAFAGGTDGGDPQAALLRAPSGLLLGTTISGGNTSGGNSGTGVVFMLSPKQSGTWKETVLYAFQGNGDAAEPTSSLVNDSAGNLYGAAGGGQRGLGAIFELSHKSSGWAEKILFNFEKPPSQGAYPASVIIDPSGNLFGTTRNGGIRGGGCSSLDGCGVAFELAPSKSGAWNETVLYSFTGGSDGSNPVWGIIRDTAGNLYGPNAAGGILNNSCPNGCGTIFKITP